jgi:hypothetical protein
MQAHRKLVIANIALAFFLSIHGHLAWANLSKAEDIVTNVIFDMDANDFVSYRAVKSLFGDYLELIFADNTPRDVAKNMIDAIKAQSPGVRISENFRGASCSRFSKGTVLKAPPQK